MIEPVLHLRSVTPYTPGRSVESVQRELGVSDLVKLASNENPYGPSPLAIEAAQRALRSVHRYNDGGIELREHLAEFYSTTVESICVGNGSDAIIHQLVRTFLGPGQSAVSSEGSFVSFRIACAALGVAPTLTPMTQDYRFDIDALAAAVTPATKVMYIPNPNNPTGTYLSKDELSRLIEMVPNSVCIVVDEAYHEYSRHIRPEDYPDAYKLGKENVVVLRTFSKAYGLAAMRIGYALGHPSVVQWLNRGKLPFDPNGIACAAAIGALADQEHVLRAVVANAIALEDIHNVAAELGFSTTESIANFVMFELGSEAAANAFTHQLLHLGFIVRPLAGFGLPTCVRISTGLPEHNQQLVATLKAIAPSIALV